MITDRGHNTISYKKKLSISPIDGNTSTRHSPFCFSYSESLYVISMIIRTDTASKPFEESFSRDEIMITVAYNSLSSLTVE